MTLRRAIKRTGEIIAECPHGGICSKMQCHRGVMWLSCGKYHGKVEGDQGLMVKCGLKAKDTK